MFIVIDSPVKEEPSEPAIRVDDQALKQRVQKIRNELLEAVLKPDCEFGDAPAIAKFRSAWSQRKNQIAELDHRIQALRSAQQEYETAESHAKTCAIELDKATATLDGYAWALGPMAFSAAKKGFIPLHPALASRMAADQHATERRKEFDELGAVGGSFFAKAKAKGQQLVIHGQIKVAELKFNQMEVEAGRRIIAAGQENDVACDDSASILKQLAATREQIETCREKLVETERALKARRDSVSQMFSVDNVAGVMSFEAEFKRCHQLRESTVAEQRGAEASISSIFADETFGQNIPEIMQLLKSLSDVEAELCLLTSSRSAPSALVSVNPAGDALSQKMGLTAGVPQLGGSEGAVISRVPATYQGGHPEFTQKATGVLQIDEAGLLFTGSNSHPPMRIPFDKVKDVLEPRIGEFPAAMGAKVQSTKDNVRVGKFLANVAGGLVPGFAGNVVKTVGGAAANHVQDSIALGAPPKNRLTSLLIDEDFCHKVIFDVGGRTRDEIEGSASEFWMRTAVVRKKFGKMPTSPKATTPALLQAASTNQPLPQSARKTVACPKCQTKLRVGNPGLVQCPKCQAKIRVPDSIF